MNANSFKRIILGPGMLVLGLFAASAGAGLATGIMAYHAIADGMDYTTISWVLIAPIWAPIALLWLLVRRWPMATAVPMGWLAIAAGVYYSDVYGYIPAAVLFLLAAAVVFLPEVSEPNKARPPAETAHM